MLTTLVDRSEGDDALPVAALAERYGGPLRFAARERPRVIANFVSTVDGLVSYAIPRRTRASLISEGYPDDRFMLALLRAVADAVVVGAGTLREEAAASWRPENVFADAGDAFARLRAAARKPAEPLLVFVTASGAIDLRLPVFRKGSPILVLTTARGADRLASPPANVRVRALGDAPPPARAILDAVVSESGAGLVLTEGGPTLFGAFLREGLVDDLFLTVAPRLAGRSQGERRLALVEGAAFTPEDAPRTRVVSLKASGEYLFLRLAVR